MSWWPFNRKRQYRPEPGILFLLDLKKRVELLENETTTTLKYEWRGLEEGWGTVGHWPRLILDLHERVTKLENK